MPCGHPGAHTSGCLNDSPPPPPPSPGIKWSGCNVRIRLWPRLPHGCHRLLSIMPMYGASAVRFVITSSTLVPASADCTGAAGSTGLLATGCILVRGHSLPVLQLLLAPFGNTRLGLDGAPFPTGGGGGGKKIQRKEGSTAGMPQECWWNWRRCLAYCRWRGFCVSRVLPLQECPLPDITLPSPSLTFTYGWV